MPDGAPILSVIIVNWNTQKELQNCLDRHFQAGSKINGAFETIIIDNASTDNSVAELEKRSDRSAFHLLKNSSNIGFASASNQGLQLAKGENLLLLNPDTLVEAECYQKILAFVPSQERIGVLGITTRNPDQSIQPSAWPEPGLFLQFIEASYLYLLLPRKLRGALLLSGYFDYAHSREVGMVLGAFFWITRACFKENGELDATLHMFGEDLDYCLRTRRKAFKVFFFRDASYVHLGNQATQQLPPDWRIERTVSSLYYVLGKFHGRVWLLAFCLLQILSFGVRTLLSPVRRWFKGQKDSPRAGYVRSAPLTYCATHAGILRPMFKPGFKNLLLQRVQRA